MIAPSGFLLLVDFCIFQKDCIEPECFNFKIIPIRSLENGDIGSKFIEDYKGLMGIKYY